MKEPLERSQVARAYDLACKLRSGRIIPGRSNEAGCHFWRFLICGFRMWRFLICGFRIWRFLMCKLPQLALPQLRLKDGGRQHTLPRLLI